MNRILVFVVSVIWASGACAQNFVHQTEPTLPIGKSPGISNVCSLVGSVARIDVDNRRIQIGDRWLTFTESARFWQDRSIEKMRFLTIDISDIRVGDKIEAKHDKCCEKFATCIEWAKVQRAE